MRRRGPGGIGAVNKQRLAQVSVDRELKRDIREGLSFFLNKYFVALQRPFSMSFTQKMVGGLECDRNIYLKNNEQDFLYISF